MSTPAENLEGVQSPRWVSSETGAGLKMEDLLKKPLRAAGHTEINHLAPHDATELTKFRKGPRLEALVATI